MNILMYVNPADGKRCWMSGDDSAVRAEIGSIDGNYPGFAAKDADAMDVDRPEGWLMFRMDSRYMPEDVPGETESGTWLVAYTNLAGVRHWDFCKSAQAARDQLDTTLALGITDVYLFSYDDYDYPDA